MSDPAAHDAYNYAVFEGQGDFDAFMGPPHVGERALDCALTDLDGSRVALSDLWRTSHIVMEFGSYT
jgi:hypothetical protein